MTRLDKDVIVKRINRSLPKGQRIRTSHGNRTGFAGNITHLFQDGQIIACIGDVKGLEAYGRTLGVLTEDEVLTNERTRHDL